MAMGGATPPFYGGVRLEIHNKRATKQPVAMATTHPSASPDTMRFTVTCQPSCGPAPMPWTSKLHTDELRWLGHNLKPTDIGVKVQEDTPVVAFDLPAASETVRVRFMLGQGEVFMTVQAGLGLGFRGVFMQLLVQQEHGVRARDLFRGYSEVKPPRFGGCTRLLHTAPYDLPLASTPPCPMYVKSSISVAPPPVDCATPNSSHHMNVDAWRGGVIMRGAIKRVVVPIEGPMWELIKSKLLEASGFVGEPTRADMEGAE